MQMAGKAAAHVIDHARHENVVVTWEQVDELKDRLRDLRAAEAEAKQELDKAISLRNAREVSLREELAVKRHQAMLLENRASELERRIKIGPPPPGPSCLRFVDGHFFLGVSSIVICANLVVMTIEVVYHNAASLQWLDEAFLWFYIIELVLRFVYHQQQFLCGPPSVVWWNWLDTVIVASGIIDRWLLPMVVNNMEEVPNYIGYLRVLRLARLARLLKLVRIFVQSDLDWAEGAAFQSFIMAIISLNALLMGFEAELSDAKYARCWFYCEQALLVIFTFELVVRFKRSGCRGFFTSPTDMVWNWLDFVIVIGGMIDQWMFPAYDLVVSFVGEREHAPIIASSLGDVMSMLRMARLLRILRLARLIKNIPPLYKLVVGIAKAMQGMAWVMLLTGMVLYICALVGVRLAGPGGLIWGDDPEAYVEVANSAFPDIYGAVFNLFKVMNADMSPMSLLFKHAPLSKFVIGIFVVITNWAIFSIMTAVVSDNMARVTEATEEEAEAEKARVKQETLVDAIFERLDRGGTGQLTASALQRMCAKETVVADLASICDMTPEALTDVCGIVRHNATIRSATMDPHRIFIQREAFLKGLSRDESAISQRSIMRVNKKMEFMEERLQCGMDSLEQVVTRGAAKLCADRPR